MENRGYDRETIKARSEEVFKQVGLVGLEDRKITSLSGGQRQRLAIASRTTPIWFASSGISICVVA